MDGKEAAEILRANAALRRKLAAEGAISRISDAEEAGAEALELLAWIEEFDQPIIESNVYVAGRGFGWEVITENEIAKAVVGRGETLIAALRAARSGK